MKKLFTTLILMLSLTIYSQIDNVQQAIVNYSSIYFSKEDIDVSLTSILKFNYPNKGDLLIEIENGDKFKLKMISEIQEGSTVGGYKYKSAHYRDDFNNLALIQVFLDVPIIRLTLENEESIEFSNKE